MPSTYLTRTPSSNGNQSKFTWSAWIKRSGLNDYENLFSSDVSASNSFRIKFGESSSDQKLDVYYYTGIFDFRVSTNRVFRDTNSWYHIVVTFDNQQSTSTDRIKIYVNGVRETSFSTSNFPATGEGANSLSKTNAPMRLGATGVPDYYFDGLMSHVHFCDGYAYDASAFGSTDSTTGEWKINTSPSVTYGTNGFFLLKDDNAVTDRSGQSNNFTVGGGTLTKTEDNPSNVFATLNPLTRINTSQSPSKIFNNANTTFEVGSNVWGEAMSTLAVSSGKYYVEFNIEKLESSNGYAQVGVMDYDLWGTTNNTYQYFLSNTASAGLRLDYRTGQSSLDTGGSSVTSNVGDFVNGDKIGLAVDMDNKAMYVHKNGVYYQVGGVTGVPTSGSSKTGALTIPASCTIVGIGCATYSTSARISVNYGNGYFRTTAVSSNSGNGYSATGNLGIFQYQPPTGYTALCTKGLNT